MPPQSPVLMDSTSANLLLSDPKASGDGTDDDHGVVVSQLTLQGHPAPPPDNTSSSALGALDKVKVKCVLVGDGAVGKTSLIVSYTTNGYPTEYMPTAFDDYSVLVTVDSTPVQMQLCDTAGQDDFDAIRPLCYPSTDVFLLCFSVVSPTSFHNVLDKWVPEIRRHAPRTPLVLVGTQCDLRNDVKVLIELARYQDKPVPEQDAIQLSHNIGAAFYLECSALTQKNLKDVFDHAIMAALNYSTSPSGVDSKGRPLRKSSRRNKYTVDASSSAHTSGHSLKKAGWKKFCCFL